MGKAKKCEYKKGAEDTILKARLLSRPVLGVMHFVHLGINEYNKVSFLDPKFRIFQTTTLEWVPARRTTSNGGENSTSPENLQILGDKERDERLR